MTARNRLYMTRRMMQFPNRPSRTGQSKEPFRLSFWKGGQRNGHSPTYLHTVRASKTSLSISVKSDNNQGGKKMKTGALFVRTNDYDRADGSVRWVVRTRPLKTRNRETGGKKKKPHPDFPRREGTADGADFFRQRTATDGTAWRTERTGRQASAEACQRFIATAVAVGESIFLYSAGEASISRARRTSLSSLSCWMMAPRW